MQITKQDVQSQFHELIIRTEDNIEQVLLHLHAMRPDDLPHIKWKWDEWQPALLNEDAYPQFHLAEQAGGRLYQVLWCIPLCGRDQTQHWHDKAGLDHGTARQVLLFQLELIVQGDIVDSMSLECFMGMYEGYKGRDGHTVESVFRNPDDNTIPISVPLLVKATKLIESLAHHLKIEKKAMQSIRDIKAQHDAWAAEAIRNRPPK